MPKRFYKEKCLKLLHNTFMFNEISIFFIVIKSVYKLLNSEQLINIKTKSIKCFHFGNFYIKPFLLILIFKLIQRILYNLVSEI